MTHFMVLAPKGESGRDSVRGSARHGRCAVERLIDDIVKQGGQKSRLEVKLFGGGQLFEGPSDAGRITVDWTLDFLRSEGLSAAKADVGGASLRTIYYLTDSGIVLLKKAGLMSAKSVIDQEAAYENSLKNELVAGAGTRF
jgi:chemotaxis protein CheD